MTFVAKGKSKRMSRTLNGEIIIDDKGNLNEQVLIDSWIEIYTLLNSEDKEQDYEHID